MTQKYFAKTPSQTNNPNIECKEAIGKYICLYYVCHDLEIATNENKYFHDCTGFRAITLALCMRQGGQLTDVLADQRNKNLFWVFFFM